jgi:hypothetical protein
MEFGNFLVGKSSRNFKWKKFDEKSLENFLNEKFEFFERNSLKIFIWKTYTECQKNFTCFKTKNSLGLLLFAFYFGGPSDFFYLKNVKLFEHSVYFLLHSAFIFSN